MSTPSNEPEKKKSTAQVDIKLESRVNVKDLEALHEAFSLEGDGYNDQLSLNRDQFIEALSLILNKGSRDEYGELFDKIDAARTGSVDWNKLASHLLLEFQEKDDRVKSNLLPQWKDLRTLGGPHKDVIERFAFLKNIGRYLAISKEGNVSLWGQDLKLQKSVKTGTDSCRTRDLWITDFVPLPNISKVAVAFTSKEIAFYDMSAKLEFNCQYKVQGLTHTPLRLDYWSNPDNNNEAILVWGDVAGFVNVLFWSSASIALFERPPAPSQDKEDLEESRNYQSETTLNVRLDDIARGMYKSTKYIKHQSHSDWVRQVRFIQSLECFISCASTWNNSMIIGWLEKHTTSGMQSTVTKKSAFEVHQGINAFDYHETLNLIATAGVNHQVCLWNPYVVSKPNGLLRGHMAPVVQVQFVRSRGQLLSFSKDKVLRIWDVQLQVCIQRIAGVFPKGQEVYSVLFFHEDRNRLFITFNYTLTLLEMKPEIKDKIMSHDRPIVAAIFNTIYNQVITACQGGTIICWMVDTGQKVKSFNNAHADAELTCMVQDETETRLFTGGTDGTVKVWDLNGHCYHQLVCSAGSPADVGQIVLLRRSVVVIGFAKFITIFRNNTFRDFIVEPSEWKGGQEHQDDIMAAAFYSPQILATGAYDGEIIIWNTNSEQASRRMTQRSRRSNPSVAGESRPESRRRSTPSTRATSGQSSSKSAARDTDNEFMFTISRMFYLDARKAAFANKTGANLISCGGNGIVRFWNSHSCRLLAEFTAHEHAGNIIMNLDPGNLHLVTGDVDGQVKVWRIEDYCLVDVDTVITEPPHLHAHWHAHTDMISSISFCERQKRPLIITTSSDFSVSLWDLHGNHIGVFGQESHWKIESEAEMQKEAEEHAEEEHETVTELEVPSEEDSMWKPPPDATENPEEYRINTWDETCLGVDYQELRVKKRPRKQPQNVPDLPYLFSERTGQPPFGPFYSLGISTFDDIEELEQPDFMEHPEKYFTDKEDLAPTKGGKMPLTTQTLKAAFDERSLFPRYILDFDHQLKKYTQYTLDKMNQPHKTSTFAQPSPLGLGGGRRPKPSTKLKPIQKSKDLGSVTSSSDDR